MFRRPARLPVNVTLGIPYEGSTPDTEENNTTTQDNLRIAFELTRRNCGMCSETNGQKQNGTAVPRVSS